MNKLIFLKKNINCLILKKKEKKIIYFFNKNIYLFINLNKKDSTIKINKNLKFVECKNFSSDFNFLLNKIFNFYIKKFSFNGKGFKLKKIKNINIFNFNNSHIKLFIEKKLKLIKNNKNSFLIIKKNNNLKIIDLILNLFKINIFTRKGLKFSRKIILVKKTKKK